MNDLIKEQAIQAAEALKRGGIILYPTDTVWGIGCDATNAAAVEKIYKLKRSENKTSMLVLVSSPDQAARYTNHVPSVAWDLMELADKPLTLILPGAVGLAENLIPEDRTTGMRIPDDDFCQALLRRFGRPIVSTSANISGEATPIDYSEISKAIHQGVDFSVDPLCEGNSTHKPSSLIQIGTTGEIQIIRE